jgi:hypothetical protein
MARPSQKAVIIRTFAQFESIRLHVMEISATSRRHWNRPSANHMDPSA